MWVGGRKFDGCLIDLRLRRNSMDQHGSPRLLVYGKIKDRDWLRGGNSISSGRTPDFQSSDILLVN